MWWFTTHPWSQLDIALIFDFSSSLFCHHQVFYACNVCCLTIIGYTSLMIWCMEWPCVHFNSVGCKIEITKIQAFLVCNTSVISCSNLFNQMFLFKLLLIYQCNLNMLKGNMILQIYCLFSIYETLEIFYLLC